MKHKSRYPKALVVIVSVFLLAVNGILGTMLIIQSGADLKSEMQDRMFDILNTAAAFLDGDVLESIQKEDYDTPEYQHALHVLGSFQQSFNLDYIYGIRDMGNGTFTFTIDPDPESPGEFGEQIQYTDALYSASIGQAAADEIPYEDRWGRFYSAYVPVFNSKGKVGGIIAVDVEAAWYEEQQRVHIITTLVICVISLIAGGLIAFLITVKIQKRLVFLNSEMNKMTDEIEQLAQELRLASGRRTDTFEYDDSYKDEEERCSKTESADGFEELSCRLKFVREELSQYIADAHELAYTDALTGSANRNAYIEAISDLNEKIMEAEADFSIAVFDINGLKNCNDNFGHEFGDLLIITTSDILKDFVGPENLYRIGGDEFVAIIDISNKSKIDDIFAAIDLAIVEANLKIEDFKTKEKLALSKGYACFKRGKDSEVQTVFRRADEAMYADKAAYYQAHDRRHR